MKDKFGIAKYTLSVVVVCSALVIIFYKKDFHPNAESKNHSISFVAHTANVLGIFNDPFEFAGDYGSDINPIREKVFDLVVSKEVLAKNMSDEQIKKTMDAQDIQEDTSEYKNKIVRQSIEIVAFFDPEITLP